jgi:hypothetical protein
MTMNDRIAIPDLQASANKCPLDQRGLEIRIGFKGASIREKHVMYQVVPMANRHTLELTIRQGTSARAAAGYLNLLAEYLDGYGDSLLNKEGGRGDLDEGVPHEWREEEGEDSDA